MKAILNGALGDHLGYWLGRRGGRPLLERYGRRLLISPRTLRRADRFFARYGQGAVFLGRFVTGLRFLAGPWREYPGCRTGGSSWQTLVEGSCG